jgi:hypothetical protein
MKQNETSSFGQVSSIFNCQKCNYNSSRKSQWERHLLTSKHKNQASVSSLKHMVLTCTEKNIDHKCLCGQFLNSRTTFWRHKKKCNFVLKSSEINKEPSETDKELSVTELVTKLINQNSELQQMLIEQNNKIFELAKEAKNITNNTTNNNNFNLQFYLNDKCKDAISLVDFVDSLNVQLDDLEETARLGYTEGVSRIIINGLNELDVCKRPIHCSDAKRETLYIKDQDEWTKEDPDKTHLSKAIKVVSKKNVQQIFEWQKKYPEYRDPDSKQSDRYMEMICNTMDASSKEEQNKNMNKIIKNITKEVIIDKN